MMWPAKLRWVSVRTNEIEQYKINGTPLGVWTVACIPESNPPHLAVLASVLLGDNKFGLHVVFNAWTASQRPEGHRAFLKVA